MTGIIKGNRRMTLQEQHERGVFTLPFFASAPGVFMSVAIDSQGVGVAYLTYSTEAERLQVDSMLWKILDQRDPIRKLSVS